MGLDDESACSPGTGRGRREPATKHGIERGLERKPALVRKLLEARGNVGIQGDGRPHEGIMMTGNCAVQMPDKTDTKRPTDRARAACGAAPHFQYVLARTIRIRTSDRAEVDVRAGDVSALGPGHDAWVVGDRVGDKVAVAVDWLGATDFAKVRRVEGAPHAPGRGRSTSRRSWRIRSSRPNRTRSTTASRCG